MTENWIWADTNNVGHIAAGSDNTESPKTDDRTQSSESGHSTTQDLAADIWKSLQSAAQSARELLPAPSNVPKLVQDALTSPACERALSRILETLSSLAPPSSEKKQWAVALNLTTDFDNDENGNFGRLEALKKFAASTKGKDLTIVVQAAFEEEDEKGKTTYSLERYVVRDGQIKRVSVAPSKGYAQDVEDLVKYTSHNQPSDKFALIIDSHGLGNLGLFGDTGSVTVDDFVKHVKNGLKGSGRDKIDLINFDTCLMAQNTAAGRISAITDHMVASADTESIYGISLTPIFQKLADKPDISPRDLGRFWISEVRQQDEWNFANEEGHVPIHTISYLDLHKYSDFSRSLDKFGDKLTEALKDPGSGSSIGEAIDSSLKYGSGGPSGLLGLILGGSRAEKTRVDLKDFVEKVVRDIESGKIQDKDRSLRTAANDVLSSRALLVDSAFGYGAPFDRHGGLSVFLPGRDLRDPEGFARLSHFAGRLAAITESSHFARINRDNKSRSEFVARVLGDINGLKPNILNLWGLTLSKDDLNGIAKEVKATEVAALNFKAATTDKERKTAFDDLHQAALVLEKTKHCRDKYESLVKSERENVAKTYTAQLVKDGDKTGWARFRLALRDSPPK